MLRLRCHLSSNHLVFLDIVCELPKPLRQFRPRRHRILHPPPDVDEGVRGSTMRRGAPILHLLAKPEFLATNISLTLDDFRTVTCGGCSQCRAGPGHLWHQESPTRMGQSSGLPCSQEPSESRSGTRRLMLQPRSRPRAIYSRNTLWSMSRRGPVREAYGRSLLRIRSAWPGEDVL